MNCFLFLLVMISGACADLSKEAELSADIRFLKNEVMALKRQLAGDSYHLIISVSAPFLSTFFIGILFLESILSLLGMIFVLMTAGADPATNPTIFLPRVNYILRYKMGS